MTSTFHQGVNDQETDYPGGTYSGDAPAAFGTLRFMSSTSGSPLTPTVDTQVDLSLTFTGTPTGSSTFDCPEPIEPSEPSEPTEPTEPAGPGGPGESGYSGAVQTTYACIIDLSTGQSTSIGGCTYDTDTSVYTCANGYYTFSAGEAVGVYRLDGGQCP